MRKIKTIPFIIIILFYISSEFTYAQKCHSDSSLSRTDVIKNELEWSEKVGAKNSAIKNTIYKVSDFGAIADGITVNTEAIQKTIDKCSKDGGGIVTFTTGKYLTGAIFLRENVHLIIPKGVIILGSTNIKDYPEIDTRVAGIEMKWPSALINVINKMNVIISGDGTINGQGKTFWNIYRKMRKDYEAKGLRWIVDYDCKRPRTLLVSESSDVTIKDLTFQQSGFWTIQLLYSTRCTVDGVTIQNNIDGRGPSTDGIDIDSSNHILVENCDIDCNDDNICLKAGRDADGLRVNRPTEYIVIRNCIARSGEGLLTCGSETSGGIRYVLAENLKAQGTAVGIRLKSAMTRGGTTEQIYIRNVEMDNVRTVFEASSNWYPAYSYSSLPVNYSEEKLPEHWKKMLQKVDEKEGIPFFKDVFLSGFKVRNSKKLLIVEGIKESLMERISLDNMDVDIEEIGYINYTKDLSITNIRLKTNDLLSLKIKNSLGINSSLPH